MAKSIVNAKEYKVQDGDSMKSIAEANGLTWQELATFNFGSDDPDLVNKGMRNQVGSFNRSADGHNMSFSSKDDPGIIYIPEEFPETAFSVDGSHTITVKQIPKKTFIASKAMVQFRPKTTWKGEYGFDWLRIGDNGETAYSSILAGGYKATVVAADGSKTYTSFTKDEALVFLKGLYKTIPTEVEAQKKYRVPRLNLYPPSAKGSSPAPPTSAELRVFITIEKEKPLKMEFDYHKGLFLIEEAVFPDADLAIGAKRESTAKTVKITCLAEFDSDQEIRVLAYPATWKLNDPLPLAGKIIVGANSRGHRKRVKFLFVNVKTQIKSSDTVRVGKVSSSEKKRLKNVFYQAYIHASFENGPDLDLTADPDYNLGVNADGTPKYGKFIYKRTDAADTNNDGAIHEDAPNSSFFKDLTTKYFDATKFPDHAKYAGYFTIFSVNEITFDPGTEGQIQDFGVHNAVLFKPSSGSREVGALAHECAHGLGLPHTHDAPFLEDCKLQYDKGKTNNVMSYNFGNMLYTWKWQWEIMHRNV